MTISNTRIPGVIRNRSIGSTLVLAATIPAIFMFIVLAWVLYYSGKDDVLNSLKNKGELVAASLSESSRYGLISGNVEELNAVCDRFIKIEPGIQRIRITKADGQEMVDVKGSAAVSVSPLTFSREVNQETLNASDADAYANTEPIDPASGGPATRSKRVGQVVVELSPEKLWSAQRQRIWASAFAILVVAIISGSVGLVMVNKLRITLRNLIHSLREVRKGNFDVRFSDEKQGELGEIQRTLVDMAFALSKNQAELESKVSARTTELREAIAKVNRVDNERQALIQDSNKKLEQERKRISVDIHDQINASLIGLKWQAEAIESLTKDEPSEKTMSDLRDAARAMTQTVGPLYAVCRSIIHQLRPEVLETLGLAGAVEDLLHGYRSTNNECTFTLEVDPKFPCLNQDQSIAIYRVIQEALNNISKHARASHAKVRMALCNKSSDAVCVEIIDDGRGFDTEAPTGGSLGLIGMRERVHGLKGKIDYSSVVGSGTTVRIHLPRVLEEIKG